MNGQVRTAGKEPVVFFEQEAMWSVILRNVMFHYNVRKGPWLARVPWIQSANFHAIILISILTLT
jgi:hypothetical protein